MDKKERNEIISTIENDANLDDREQYLQVANTRIQADIAYELTNCVVQLKRIADKMEPTKHIVDICPNCMSLPDATPSSDGALRTAVEEIHQYA